MPQAEFLSYFRHGVEPGLFHAVDNGLSGWHADQLHGSAITGLLTRTAALAADALDPNLQLIRASFDLFAGARTIDTRVRTELVRRGGRVTLIDAFFSQNGRDVARGHFFFS